MYEHNYLQNYLHLDLKINLYNNMDLHTHYSMRKKKKKYKILSTQIFNYK